MAASLSAAAHGVFSAEPSLTNRSGRFTIMRWPKPIRGGQLLVSPSEELSPANCNDFAPLDAKIDELCHDHVESKVSPRTSLGSPEHEPDAEPGTLDSPRPSESSHTHSEMEKRHGEEVRCLTAQVRDAKEQVERLKCSQLKLNSDITSERKGRKEAEDLASKLQSKCHIQEQSLIKLKNDKNRLCKEKAGLEKKVQQLRKVKGSKSSCHGQDFERLAMQMAETECGPLNRCTADEKAALKKKLLLKWHPDKQPSADHSHFATRVVQEMQNNTAWQE